ncbi:hypothetical protein H0H81_010215 [Sphagnurus paluster]|uniref:Chitin synthase n=1 Tax=Sphagnurus paluster TaxID=117069 RepID=A0A9P7FT35_9AGAR|nr:hypothetical protein H0H81_010215 [Sphagnurus paluster]
MSAEEHRRNSMNFGLPLSLLVPGLQLPLPQPESHDTPDDKQSTVVSSTPQEDASSQTSTPPEDASCQTSTPEETHFPDLSPMSLLAGGLLGLTGVGLSMFLSQSGIQTAAGHIPEPEPLKVKPVTRPLVNGHYVVNLCLPTEISECTVHDDVVSSHLRYSAVTCGPDEFSTSGFTLLQDHNPTADPPRETELFIAITMYNEDEELFCRTMNGVVKNITELCKRKDDPKWGADSWKKVVVCIISDGRKKINPGTLAAIAKIGAYQEKTALQYVETDGEKKEVVAHVYEYTTQVTFSSALPSIMAQEAAKTIPPIQIIFCLKEKNQKKINSHRWFFNAFSARLKPRVCVLLDVGTMPGPTSLYHLWKAFDINEHVGGACGEIVAYKGQYGEALINPLVAAQNFEYKMSNILDKPVESVLGYITVLPGAFSAYRYEALLNDERGEGPLQKYFLGDLTPNSKPDLFTANMYLAEDRANLVLGIGIKAQFLLGAPLRQISGNYYIGFVVLSTSLEHYVPGFKYPNILLNYAYVGLLIMSFLMALGNRPQGSRSGYIMVFFGFGFLMMYMTAASFTVAYQGLKSDEASDRTRARHIIISLMSSLGLYIFASIIALDPWHTFTSFIQYLLISPSYITVLNVYAFANIHDVTWGTKADVGPVEDSQDLGSATAISTNPESNSVESVKVPALKNIEEIDKAYENAKKTHSVAKELAKIPFTKPAPDLAQQQEDFFKGIRTYVTLFWILSNALLAAIVTSAIPSAESKLTNPFVNAYFVFILYSLAWIAFIRFVGSSAYMTVWLFAGTAIEFFTSVRT